LFSFTNNIHTYVYHIAVLQHLGKLHFNVFIIETCTAIDANGNRDTIHTTRPEAENYFETFRGCLGLKEVWELMELFVCRGQRTMWR